MILIIQWLVFFTSLSGTPDCKEDILQAYDKLKEAYGKEQKNVFIKYSVSSTNWQGEEQEETISFLLTATKSKVVSEKSIIYQDQNRMVAIDKLGKKILITKPSSEDWRAKQMKAMATVFDTLFHKLKVISCERQCQEGSSKELFRKIKFEIPLPTNKMSSGPETITYWLEEKNPMIRKIEMAYKVGSPLKSTSFRLLELKLNHQENPFKGSAEEQVMANGKLIKAFKDFTLVDTRK